MPGAGRGGRPAPCASRRSVSQAGPDAPTLGGPTHPDPAARQPTRVQAPLRSVSDGGVSPGASVSVPALSAGADPAPEPELTDEAWRAQGREAGRAELHRRVGNPALPHPALQPHGLAVGGVAGPAALAPARRYASAVCASGARDALPSGGTARAPGGAVTRISRSILPGPRSPRARPMAACGPGRAAWTWPTCPLWPSIRRPSGRRGRISTMIRDTLMSLGVVLGCLVP